MIDKLKSYINENIDVITSQTTNSVFINDYKLNDLLILYNIFKKYIKE